MAEPGRVQVTPAKDIGFMGATVSQTLKKKKYFVTKIVLTYSEKKLL